MDHEHLVRRASGGDVEAFVDLTRRFQHFAFGSALALVRDFQRAEDVVQEAFVAAWAGLPGLADPAAFPGWLRGIVRHQAFRMLRRRQLRTAPSPMRQNYRATNRRPIIVWRNASTPPLPSQQLPSCPTSCASRQHCSSCTSARTKT